eukprot:GHUV01010311.1.p1 GENE.GHUV01010311.1~~GHUV01010311.1.p1  ORF type:complete len:311 (+),score=99.09 GHUV01010311.1:286-1218(+)
MNNILQQQHVCHTRLQWPSQTAHTTLCRHRWCSGQLKQRTCLRVRAAADQEQVPDASFDFVARNQNFVRSVPLWAGGLGFVSLLANRTLSGIAPVVDASSSQSRADVLGILLSAVLLLTGLQWLALKPKPIEAVALDGVPVNYINPSVKLPKAAEQEMQWAWESLQATSRATSMVVMYQGRSLFHAGMARAGYQLGTATAGEVAQKAMETGKGNYLANLVLYPGRDEFVKYLPEATQGVIVQPLGNAGVMVVGTDTLRGLSRLDQAWIANIADKLEVSLEGYTVTGTGFAKASSSSSSRKEQKSNKTTAN